MAFAAEHFPTSAPSRVEWIDDTSANLVYENAVMATAALASFSLEITSEDVATAVQLRAARSLSTSPDARLEVRMATTQDRKQRGARERSRFYLFHPDEDPGEHQRRRTQESRHRPRLTNANGDHGDYRRRRYDHAEHRRRRNEDEDGTGFDAGLYDDEDDNDRRHLATRSSREGSLGHYTYSEGSLSDRGGGGGRWAKRRQPGRFSRGDQGARELFPDGIGRKRRTAGGDSGDGGFLRDRSASPGRLGGGGTKTDGDNDLMMDDQGGGRVKRQRRYRERSRSPMMRTRSHGVLMAHPRDVSAQIRGLHPSTSSTSNATTTATKELFPRKLAGDDSTTTTTTTITKNAGHHRRSDAFDAADETANLFARGMSVPFTDGSMDRRRHDDDVIRIRRGHGRNNDGDNIGMSIRGSAAAAAAAAASTAPRLKRDDKMEEEGKGMSIKGLGRELFPGKVIVKGGGVLSGGDGGGGGNGGSGGDGMNSGKELFAEKIQGRGTIRRRKAEDMFHY